MKLKYLAHSSFLLTSSSGIRIITDPYHTGADFRHEPVNEPADIVTVSHGHGDHNAVSTIPGSPDIISVEGTAQRKGITIKGIPTFHDESGGQQRGENIVFCFSIDEIDVCHLGDLGHALDTAQIKELGNVDVLLIPVGGFFTIDAKVATKICDDLNPKIVVPMHYKTQKQDLPINGIEGFISGKQNVKQSGVSEMQIEKRTLPENTEIYVLNPAL
jgi:L-ascorbate metabolism protein UlaG (beta-lactamase superfamily)